MASSRAPPARAHGAALDSAPAFKQRIRFAVWALICYYVADVQREALDARINVP